MCWVQYQNSCPCHSKVQGFNRCTSLAALKSFKGYNIFEASPKLQKRTHTKRRRRNRKGREEKKEETSWQHMESRILDSNSDSITV